jgi:hypothetical protein
VGKEPWSDLSVQIGSRPWRIVPDPLLCLSRDGAAFVGGLAGTHMAGHSPRAEVWLAPEFHSILDDWMLHDKHPEVLAQSLGSSEDPDELQQALRLWLRLRDVAGRPDGRLCWVRDALRESCLPTGIEDSIVSHWEAMAQALDERLASAGEASGPGIAAFRDCAALCAVLTDAILLCALESDHPNPMPVLCRHLEAWRLPCRRLQITDDMVCLERGLLLRLLVELGLASFIWGGLRLAVVHFAVPGLFRLPNSSRGFSLAPEELDLPWGELRPIKSPLEHAQVFWYDLSAEEAHA